MAEYIVALDQGTTSSRAIIFDHELNIKGVCQREFTQIYPNDGWCEHDPTEIWSSQLGVFMDVIFKNGIRPDEIKAIGIANQRETTIVWDKTTGRPVYNAIVWQCRRTASICEDIINDDMASHIQQTTGLIPDPYFSATKIKWILDNVPEARNKAVQGDLLFGTVDTWLLWNLTRGKVHATDVTNASRTMLYDIVHQCWDQTILDYLEIPCSMLPNVCDSSHLFGTTHLQTLNGIGPSVDIPISGVVGDQQGALFGQMAFNKGDVKNTYGTGCFLLMNTGSNPIYSNHGLLTTIAVGINGKVEYALEGSVFVGGAVVQWIRDELKIIDDSADTAYFASKVPDNGGVYIVPAFVGLGAPYWDPHARGTIIGLTRGSNKNHIIRAALESIAYQSRDVIDAMKEEVGVNVPAIRVDGGASRNELLMQFQADITGVKVIRPRNTETTALGAACLAGLSVGFWKDKAELTGLANMDTTTFDCKMDEDKRERYYGEWKKAVSRSLSWNQI